MARKKLKNDVWKIETRLLLKVKALKDKNKKWLEEAKKKGVDKRDKQRVYVTDVGEGWVQGAMRQGNVGEKGINEGEIKGVG